MKTRLFFFPLLILLSILLRGQTYPSSGIKLLSMINPNSGDTALGMDGRRYSGCWGWQHPTTGHEYAIVGASNGVYFIDVTNPENPQVSAFVRGKSHCSWREIKTYKNYCYVVSDDPAPNVFQIFDLLPLSSNPSTVNVVHNSKNIFENGHTIYIDGNKMYVGTVTYSVGSNPGFSSLDVYSLSTPTQPTFLRRLSQDYSFIPSVHDMFVKHDTVYASCGALGIQVIRYDSVENKFNLLGSFNGYASSMNNHSSWLTPNNKYLVFCDEAPVGSPIRLVDVQDPSNIRQVSEFLPNATSTAHNPYVLNNDFVAVACYQDGLNIYNISDPGRPFLAGYFDTYPQGGINTGSYPVTNIRGNWGAYPYLPSKNIIAVDIQNGIFILNPTEAFSTQREVPQEADPNAELFIYPSIGERVAVISNTGGESIVKISNTDGQTVYEKTFEGKINYYVDGSTLPSGTYFVSLYNNQHTSIKKLIINH